MKHPRTIEKENNRLYELWKAVPVGSARGWFLLGALFALSWVKTSHSLPSKFAGKPWECDET